MLKYLLTAIPVSLVAPILVLSGPAVAETVLTCALTNGEGDLPTGTEIVISLADDRQSGTLNVGDTTHPIMLNAFVPNGGADPDDLTGTGTFTYVETEEGTASRGAERRFTVAIYANADATRIVTSHISGAYEFQSADPCPAIGGNT